MTTASRNGMAGLCLGIALLAGAAAGVGVFARGDGTFEQVTSERGERYAMATSGVYRFNSERMVAEGVGWDVFTLFLAVPALLAALPALRRGSLRGRLFALGLLGYFFYQYLMYATGWAFGPLFLVFVAIYAASLAGIVWIASSFELASLPARFGPRFPARGMAVYSLLMGLLLVGMWLGRIIPAHRGALEGLLLGQTTLVVQALDLGLMVPLALFTAATAWRRRPVGYLLCSVLAVKGAAMAAAITFMLLGAWRVQGTLEVVPLALFLTSAGAAVWLGARMYRSALPEAGEVAAKA